MSEEQICLHHSYERRFGDLGVVLGRAANFFGVVIDGLGHVEKVFDIDDDHRMCEELRARVDLYPGHTLIHDK